MRHLLLVTVATLALAALGGRRAHAYPQFQLSRDVTCTACHLSPAGGSILNENGTEVADTIAWKPGAPEFMHGAIPAPSWLRFGGDLRAAGGFVYPGTASAAFYPMQAELSAAASAHGFSLVLIGGLRRPQDDNIGHMFWSREHYIQWQQHEDAPGGLFVRVGRLMPVYGLRLAEHVVYTQRYGGQPLYSETYAASVSYVTNPIELHATAFMHDPIASTVEHGDGVAFYAETRIGSKAAVGAEAKYSSGPDETNTFGGITGKLYLADADVLLQAEGELVHQRLVTGDRINQLLGYLLASKPFGSFLLDVGLGHWTEDMNVQGLYRDCLDANVHWFMTSHVEWLLTTRLELLDHGNGPTGGYALAQIHYRL